MVKAKKYLGQHFLKDEYVAMRIVDALKVSRPAGGILEIGPGTGALTGFLAKDYHDRLVLIDIDRESIDYLKKHFAALNERIVHGDFINDPLAYMPDGSFHIIGNFPYNISSQIFFKILAHHHRVDTVVGMLQYEVAKRLTSPPGNRAYGLLSVLLQTYYTVEYLFDVEPHAFYPPPKVRSGVIRMMRNGHEPACSQALFTTVVKQGFQNRRKTLRNALKPLNLPGEVSEMKLLDKRAEALSSEDFETLTKEIEKWRH